MATVLIAEPAAEVRALLTHLVTRLGHTPAECNDVVDLDDLVGGPARPGAAIVEPADPATFVIAERLRKSHATLPLVFVSVLPRTAESDALDPVAHVMKPFEMRTLRAAVASALERAGGR